MEEYRFKGIDLTGKSFGKILIQEMKGKKFTRQDAINIVKKYHLDNGGICERKSYVATFKASTRIYNEIVNISYGYWQIVDGDKPVQVVIKTPKENTISYMQDKVIGEGKDIVYVYYYDGYKELYSLKKSDIYPCKVGMSSKREPLQRIIEQATSTLPEKPHIGLIIKCDDSKTLESALHNVLRLRGRQINDSVGTEWFLTTPNEIEEIFYLIK